MKIWGVVKADFICKPSYRLQILLPFGIYIFSLFSGCAGIRIGTPPSNISPPSVTGFALVNQVLKGTDGSWMGNPIPSFTYQWYRNSSPISGATSVFYSILPEDANTSLSLFVTATNSIGESVAQSSPIAVQAITAPSNLSLPLLSGSTIVGQKLTTTNGLWSGNPTPTFSFQWYRDGIAITGATLSEYILVVADIGAKITIRVIATNSAGTSSATSLPTSVVTAIPTAPINTGLPVITGQVAVSSILNTTDGTWTGNPNPTFTYQWFRNATPIDQATENILTLLPADMGTTITVRVRATNTAGSADASSAATAMVIGPPQNTVLPTISGLTTVHQALTANTGTWLATPSATFAFQWMRSGVPIPGATNSTYTAIAQDIGSTLRIQVSATNSQKTVIANSLSTLIIAGISPVNTTLPTITGTAVVGQTLTVNDGVWTGTPSPTLARKWKRNGTDIVGATGSTYTLVPSDSGTTISVEVTATNSQGAWICNPAIRTSAPTATVTGVGPVNTGLPGLLPLRTVGQTLSVADGIWTGTTPITFSYVWLRNGVEIQGETGNSKLLVSDDVGFSLTVQVTATNVAGSSTALTPPSSMINGINPASLSLPTISGSTTIGQSLIANDGNWVGIPTPSITKQWNKNGVAIPGATGSSYVVRSGDSGSNISVTILATSSQGGWTSSLVFATSFNVAIP